MLNEILRRESEETGGNKFLISNVEDNKLNPTLLVYEIIFQESGLKITFSSLAKDLFKRPLPGYRGVFSPFKTEVNKQADLLFSSQEFKILSQAYRGEVDSLEKKSSFSSKIEKEIRGLAYLRSYEKHIFSAKRGETLEIIEEHQRKAIEDLKKLKKLEEEGVFPLKREDLEEILRKVYKKFVLLGKTVDNFHQLPI